MNWWRAHHGISNDSKLAVCALRAKAKRCEVLSIWIALLDFASQNEDDRGSIVGLDHEQIAVMTDISMEQVESIMCEFQRRGLVDCDGKLTSWDKRQPKREREDTDSSDRVRQFRRKQKTSFDVTPCNANDSHVTPRNAQSRGDERREEKKGEECREGDPFSPPKNGGGPLLLEPPTLVSGNASQKPRARKPNRTIEEIRKALGATRLTWWEAFWKVYPCHGGTNEAMDAYERRILTREVAVQAYNAAKRYAVYVAEKTQSDPKFTPKWGQGWINKERYIDNLDLIEPEQAPRKPIKIDYIDPMAQYFEKKREEERLKAEAEQRLEEKVN